MNPATWTRGRHPAPTTAGYVVSLSRNRAMMRCGTHHNHAFLLHHAEVDYVDAIQEMLKHNQRHHRDDQSGNSGPQ